MCLLSYYMQLHFIQSLVGYETGASEQVSMKANVSQLFLHVCDLGSRLPCRFQSQTLLMLL